MRIFVLLVVSLFAAVTSRAGILAEVSVASQEDIAKRAIPITYVVEQKPSGETELKIALKQPSGVPGTFNSFELRVMNAPVNPASVKSEFFLLDRILWRKHTREKTATFTLKPEELSHAYLVISHWTHERREMATLRNLCVPLAALD